MSDIRYNSWLHRSGTGGVYQDSSGRVGIGTSLGMNCLVNSGPNALTFGTGATPAERVRIDTSGRMMVGNTSAASMYSVANNLVVGSGSGSEGMTIFSDSNNDGFVVFADGTSDPGYRMGQIIYSHQQNKFHFRTNGNTDRLLIDNAGNVNISGITTAKAFVPTEGQTSHKNLLMNGNMQIVQRGSNFTSISGITTYPVDRFIFSSSGDSVWSATQSTAGSVLANTGFAHAVKIDCTTADTSLSNTNEFWISQRIEAQSLQHLRYGNAAAVTLTLSFWTRSNKTGDYGLWFYAQDGARQYATTYTISSADTWEKKVITIPGDSSGTINNDTGSGMEVRWYLGAGSSYSGTPSGAWTGTLNNRTTTLNLADSTSNEWYLTGAQLEVGSVATPFEVRSYGDELARCQRYYYTLNNNTTTYYWFFPINNGNYRRSRITYPVTMRAAPTVSGATGANNGTAGTPTGTQHVDIDHTEFHWDVSNSAHLVDLRSADFSSEL